MRVVSPLLVVGVVLACCAPSATAATTVALEPGRILVTGGGTGDHPLLRMAGGFLTVSDDTGVVVGTGCQSAGADARCDVTGVREVSVILDGDDDRLDAGGNAPDAVSLPMAIDGGAGDDVLTGGRGDDGVDGGAGADRLEGGGGVDTVHYDLRAGVRVTVGTGADDGDESDGGARDDVAADIETVNGSPGNDQLTGGPGRDRLVGGAGADVIEGGLGEDELLGGPGADSLSALDLTVDLVYCGDDFDQATIDRFVDWVVGCEGTGIDPSGVPTPTPTPTPGPQNVAPVRARITADVRSRQDVVRNGAAVTLQATAAVDVQVVFTIKLRRRPIVLRSTPIALRESRRQVVRIRLSATTARRVRREDRRRNIRVTVGITAAFSEGRGLDAAPRSFLHTRH